jgi:thiol:disulfide interchange protein DsbC
MPVDSVLNIFFINLKKEFFVYRRFSIALLGGLFICTTAHAKPPGNCGSNCIECHSLTPAEAESILKNLGTVKSVQISPVKGLWELSLERDGRQAVVFMDFAKKHLIAGPVFEISAETQSSTTPQQNKEDRKVDISSIPLTDSIFMGNPMGRYRIFVFTDPDCPFCARQHAELKKLVAMDKSVAVYIKMFPLKLHPNAYDKARVILGSNSLEMLDRAFMGEKLREPGVKDTQGPVDKTIQVAESLGIKGTPALVLSDGSVVTGFRDAGEIQKTFN